MTSNKGPKKTGLYLIAPVLLAFVWGLVRGVEIKFKGIIACEIPKKAQ